MAWASWPSVHDRHLEPKVRDPDLSSHDRRTTREHGPPYRLPRRQFQVARLVAGGLSNKEVATVLRISPRTVQHTLQTIFQKMRLRTRYELIVAVMSGALYEQASPPLSGEMEAARSTFSPEVHKPDDLTR